jgi:hypothetical protein
VNSKKQPSPPPNQEELAKNYGELMQRYNEILVELEHLRKHLFQPNANTNTTPGKEL